MNNHQSAFILFKTEDENISVDVRFEEDTVWLSQEQMSVLFGKARTTITEHIGNVFDEGELEQNRTCRKFRLTIRHGAIEGKTQTNTLKLYNMKYIKDISNNEIEVTND